MRRGVLCILLTVSLSHVATGQEMPIYIDDSRLVDERIEDALQRMTIEEKVAVTHAQSKFSSPGVARLGIPEFWMTDGPHGIRPEVLWDEWEQAGWTSDSCVAFPALTCLAATWSTDCAAMYGKCIGEEARYRNKDVLLGPGVNIYRTPLNGRNFEYMGEDPYLAGHIASSYIKGVQRNGVAACVKHYALNNQETNRHTTNVSVDERTLHEIYLPAFKYSVTDGGAWCVMGAYNLYNNQHACHNSVLINDILKGEWGFDGVVLSDWGGVSDTDEAVKNGLDMEFGTWTNGLSESASNKYGSYYLALPYLNAIRNGRFDTKELDDKVRRILRLAFRTTMSRNRPWGSLCSEEHYNVARRVGEEGIVLLKNERELLPIQPNVRRILVVGENAVKMMTVGGGSSSLKAQHEVSPLEGIRKRFGHSADVVYARGYVGDASGEYNGVTSGQNLSDSRTPEQLIDEAVELARKVDYVIMFGGLNKSNHQDCEGSDRESMDLPYSQDRLIEALSAVNQNLIYVNVSGNAVSMPWISKVPAILQAWYLGSETGNSLAAVLSGDVNPSGKLPFTFPVSLSDVAAHSLGEYPGHMRTDGSQLFDECYREGIMVGYRWFDRRNHRVLFPFGHGLSYTNFEYGKVSIDRDVMSANDTLKVCVTVKNTGSRDGAEVVQLYIRDVKSSLPRPYKELKGFSKIYLAPGEEKTVTFSVERSALSFYDDRIHEWVAEPGQFEALVASSSTDVRSRARFVLR